jgi:hypothetical protein
MAILSCNRCGHDGDGSARIPLSACYSGDCPLGELGLGQVWPIPVAWPNWTFRAGLALFTVPHVFGVWAHGTFHRHRATVNPRGDVVEIVTDGPYRDTRNPCGAPTDRSTGDRQRSFAK